MIVNSVRKLIGGSGAFSLCAAAIVSAGAAEPAKADTWGCQVILCLATPGSPTTYAECVPPIMKLWHSFSVPSCSEGGAAATSTKVDDGYVLTVHMPDSSTKTFMVDTTHGSVSDGADTSPQ